MTQTTEMRPRHSRWNVAAIVLACVPFGVLGVCMVAAMLGVHDSEGIIYAFTFPFGAAVICWPSALICRAIGIALDVRRGATTRAGVLIQAVVATSILVVAYFLMRQFGAF